MLVRIRGKDLNSEDFEIVEKVRPGEDWQDTAVRMYCKFKRSARYRLGLVNELAKDYYQCQFGYCEKAANAMALEPAVVVNVKRDE